MYREPITNFITQTDGDKPLLLVPKNGGLNSYVRNMLPEIGISIDTEKLESEALCQVGDVSLEIRVIRGEDIPVRLAEYANIGRRAYGLTGDDLYDEFVLGFNSPNESGVEKLNTYDWFDTSTLYGRPALCFLGKTELDFSWNSLPSSIKIGVSSKYERTAKNFLERRLIQPREYILNKYSGDVENTVYEGINDYCIDVVYSGGSIKGKLQVIEPVRFSDIVLLGQKSASSTNTLGSIDILAKEYSRIAARLGSPAEVSYTANLLANENELVKKIGSESAELVRELIRKGDNLPGEAADMIYATVIAVVRGGVSYEQLTTEMKSRWK